MAGRKGPDAELEPGDTDKDTSTTTAGVTDACGGYGGAGPAQRSHSNIEASSASDPEKCRDIDDQPQPLFLQWILLRFPDSDLERRYTTHRFHISIWYSRAMALALLIMGVVAIAQMWFLEEKRENLAGTRVRDMIHRSCVTANGLALLIVTCTKLRFRKGMEDVVLYLMAFSFFLNVLAWPLAASATLVTAETEDLRAELYRRDDMPFVFQNYAAFMIQGIAITNHRNWHITLISIVATTQSVSAAWAARAVEEFDRAVYLFGTQKVERGCQMQVKGAWMNWAGMPAVNGQQLPDASKVRGKEVSREEMLTMWRVDHFRRRYVGLIGQGERDVKIDTSVDKSMREKDDENTNAEIDIVRALVVWERTGSDPGGQGYFSNIFSHGLPHTVRYGIFSTITSFASILIQRPPTHPIWVQLLCTTPIMLISGLSAYAARSHNPSTATHPLTLFPSSFSLFPRLSFLNRFHFRSPLPDLSRYIEGNIIITSLSLMFLYALLVLFMDGSAEGKARYFTRVAGIVTNAAEASLLGQRGVTVLMVLISAGMVSMTAVTGHYVFTVQAVVMAATCAVFVGAGKRRWLGYVLAGNEGKSGLVLGPMGVSAAEVRVMKSGEIPESVEGLGVTG
ncbi:hypothetical protein HDU85_005199 [Gaertneriomyces sp. JEL0708]|nr:hypothetical protein HDU85_005199 [Gaertneriomyces sp. JEL0708]